MAKLNFVKFLSFFVALVGLLVAIGWIFDIIFLRDILPGMVPMKFTTAICFIASSIVLYFTAQEQKEGLFISQMVLPSAILFIFLVMVTLFISSVFGFHTSIDIFLIQEKVGEITVILGRAAISSMINFILIAIAGILTFAGFKKHLFWFGAFIAFVGGVAVIGYIINQPFLYFAMPISGINTAMALSSAILFILVGIGFILCGKIVLKQN